MVVDVVDEFRKEDEVLLEEEVEVEVDGIVKCKGGNDGDAKTGQGSTGVANIDIPIKVDLTFRRFYFCVISDLVHFCIDVRSSCSSFKRLLFLEEFFSNE